MSSKKIKILIEKLVLFLVTRSNVSVSTCGKLVFVKPHLERRGILGKFCHGNVLPFLIKLVKLIQIQVLISMQARPMGEVYDKCKIWVRFRTL